MRIGFTEILLILAVILILFGSKKLPDIARSIGKGIKELKKSLDGSSEETKNGSDGK